MTRGFVYPRVEHIDVGDREMACPGCAFRAFSSEAPELVERGRACPRCGTALILTPDHVTVDVDA